MGEIIYVALCVSTVGRQCFIHHDITRVTGCGLGDVWPASSIGTAPRAALRAWISATRDGITAGYGRRPGRLHGVRKTPVVGVVGVGEAAWPRSGPTYVDGIRTIDQIRIAAPHLDMEAESRDYIRPPPRRAPPWRRSWAHGHSRCGGPLDWATGRWVKGWRG